jgi:N6-adenosine-specific RNA methylase IME4
MNAPVRQTLRVQGREPSGITVGPSGAMLGLPKFREPTNLVDAKAALLNLGRQLNENAYIVGRHLIWVKKAVGHGNFLSWLEANVGMTDRWARYWMTHARECDKRGYLLSAVRGKSEHCSNSRPSPLPEGKFRVIYADPPWSYSNSGFKQSAASIYQTMKTEAICELPIADLAGEDSVLFLWVTTPLQMDAVEVVKAWGFTFKSKVYWIKDRAPGMAFWFRGQVEELWACAKGSPRLPEDPPVNVISAPVTRHSAKPTQAYDMIEGMFAGPYVELFARNARRGWTAWGNECTQEERDAC